MKNIVFLILLIVLVSGCNEEEKSIKEIKSTVSSCDAECERRKDENMYRNPNIDLDASESGF